MRALSPGKDARRKVVQEEMSALQQQVLTLLHLHFAPDELTAQQSSFGQRLRQHRKAAELTKRISLDLQDCLRACLKAGTGSHRTNENGTSDPMFGTGAKAHSECAWFKRCQSRRWHQSQSQLVCPTGI